MSKALPNAIRFLNKVIFLSSTKLMLIKRKVIIMSGPLTLEELHELIKKCEEYIGKLHENKKASEQLFNKIGEIILDPDLPNERKMVILTDFFQRAFDRNKEEEKITNETVH
jgi:hypothetical protein